MVIKIMVITVIRTRTRPVSVSKNLHQKTHRQTKLTENKKQGGNICDYMIMREKYNENASGGKLVKCKNVKQNMVKLG